MKYYAAVYLAYATRLLSLKNMHSPEPAKHKELRSALRAIKTHVEGLEAHELD